MAFRLPPTIRQILSHHRKPSTGLVNKDFKVEINGWIKHLRKQKNIAFALVNDGSCAEGLQAVFLEPEVAKGCVNFVHLTYKS